jgi:DNA-directed RNA polymerase specialized sigma24 family protein
MSRRAAATSAAAPSHGAPTQLVRRRLYRALSRCAVEERVLLALLLFERLTPAEAAEALSISVADVESRFDHLLAELEGTVRGVPFRARRTAPAGLRLRRAS